MLDPDVQVVVVQLVALVHALGEPFRQFGERLGVVSVLVPYDLCADYCEGEEGYLH